MSDLAMGNDGVVPGVPHLELDPDIIFLVFLPPLIHAAAYQTSVRTLMRETRPVTVLAVGGVGRRCRASPSSRMLELRDHGAVSAAVVGEVERELDLEEARVRPPAQGDGNAPTVTLEEAGER